MDPNQQNFWINSQHSDNSQYIPENVQTSQKTLRTDHPWDTKEDMALMSAWVFVSEDPTRGKNQKKGALFSRVKKYYDETREENPEGMRERNENQMKGRWTRLNKNANKWVAAYKEAYRQKRSGMSMADIEKSAHAIYEGGGGRKFLDLLVFNQVMCKHPKWEIKLDCDTTRSRTEYEMGCEDSGGSTKRSKTTEEEDTDQESPIVGRSTIQRPTGRDAAKKRGKGKASQSSSFSNDFSTELHAMTITRNNEVELLTKKTEL